MQTVELIGDQVFERTVREVWQRLAAEGVPSLALSTHPEHRPHLTLAVCGGFPPGAVEQLDALLAEALPLPVRLTGLLSWSARSRRRVLSWAVVPTLELIELHDRVWRLLADASDPDPRYQPGRWSPHVGLTRRIDPEQLQRAHEVLGRMPDLGARFTTARTHNTGTQQTDPLGQARPSTRSTVISTTTRSGLALG